jgi:hypothetical protein
VRIFQDDRDEILEIKNKIVDRIICLENFYENNNSLSSFIFWLQLTEQQSWYRFFLDAGACFWEKYDELDRNRWEEFDEADRLHDLTKRYHLQNLTILSALVNPKGNNGVKLEINFNCDRKLIVWREEFEGSDRLEVI